MRKTDIESLRQYDKESGTLISRILSGLYIELNEKLPNYNYYFLIDNNTIVITAGIIYCSTLYIAIFSNDILQIHSEKLIYQVAIDNPEFTIEKVLEITKNYFDEREKIVRPELEKYGSDLKFIEKRPWAGRYGIGGIIENTKILPP